MKLFAAILALLLAICSTASAYEGPDWGRGWCRSLHPKVCGAINTFCNHGYSSTSRIFTGDNWATNGVRNGNAWVRIAQSCGDRQYVPWDVCFKQFYDMCVYGTKERGEANRDYGRNGCQHWIINNPP
ncbi:hypothetical protein B0A48_03983 [Cryoendolithus antarcticus]|uniref:Uncharacterized protein n=1 Tax=Cryoendolithus antarcticus TaxID=1507870 RepID=A0A1V8TH16_9PEZI|nr:hypothetical protein B0A48_03983 [Cryoendolithus antarcticus]